MDFLLDNPLAAMYGPTFLVLYAVFAIVTLAVTAIAKSNIDKTDRMSTPAIPPQIDPYEVAYLRGGEHEMARAVVFALVQKGFAAISADGKGRILKHSEAPDPRNLSEIERQALDWLGHEREAKEVFDTSVGLSTRLKRFGQIHGHSLESRQFIATDLMKMKARTYARTAALLLGALGAYKILAAILNGRSNVLFAILLTIAAVLIALTMRKLPRMTKLGKKYLERLQTAFDDLKYKSQAPYIAGSTPTPVAAQAGFAGVDPLLLSVGVFGTSILAGTMFSSYNDTFARAQQQAGSSSGCGSSCSSSCSSGCGSGCGGGCGGCS